MVDIVHASLEDILTNEETLKEWEISGKPKLIPDCVSAWPACERWTGTKGKQRITELAGNAVIEVLQTPLAAP